MDEKSNIRKKVKEGYSKIATGQECCCTCSGEKEKLSKSIGYSDEELRLAPEANMGLGCGNPLALAQIKEGDTVLDLGSGAGLDCMIASKKVGDSGKVIGVDMTEEMVNKARIIASKNNMKNVEYKLGHIEKLPVDDSSVDIIISNCVINLSPDKPGVFNEAMRVLKPGGSIFLSDIVLLGELSEEQKNDDDLLCGCVAGAMQKDDYLSTIKEAGFEVDILGEDKEISKRQYSGIALESIKIKATKPDR